MARARSTVPTYSPRLASWGQNPINPPASPNRPASNALMPTGATHMRRCTMAIMASLIPSKTRMTMAPFSPIVVSTPPKTKAATIKGKIWVSAIAANKFLGTRLVRMDLNKSPKVVGLSSIRSDRLESCAVAASRLVWSVGVPG